MANRGRLLVGVVLLASVATPAAGQDLTWRNQWYWGVQSGAQAVFINTRQVAPTVGAHWFITAGRSALYVAFDQHYMQNSTQILRTGQNVQFSNAQRFQATVFAVPSDSRFQVMLGGGFAINKITNAGLLAVGTALDQRDLQDAATKASLTLAGGWQYRTGLRWALFGHYQYVPGNTDYVIRSAQHSLVMGVRYRVAGAQEIVSTER